MYVGWAIYKILDALKIAVIIPVFKEDNRNDCAEFGLQIYETMTTRCLNRITEIHLDHLSASCKFLSCSDTRDRHSSCQFSAQRL
jgi:hypothetical protein